MSLQKVSPASSSSSLSNVNEPKSRSRLNKKLTSCFTRHKFSYQPRTHNMEAISAKLSLSTNSLSALQKHYPCADSSTESTTEGVAEKGQGQRRNKHLRGFSFGGGGFRERFELFLNVVNHICIGFITIYMSWLCFRLNLFKTALHAWLVTIGFCFLMAEAVMCHYDCNALTFPYKRKTKTTIHWILQVIGGGCGLAGGLVKMIEKEFLFTSIHGKLGLAACILCSISLVTGLSAFFSKHLKRFFKPLHNKTIHNLLGLCTFILAMGAQYYGYRTGFFRRNSSTDFGQLMKAITLASLLLTIVGPLKALYRKFLTICMKS